MRMALTACGLALAAMVSPAAALTLDSPTSGAFAEHVSAVNGLSNATLLIVRHAEKTGFGTGLSPAGDMRAQVYARYFRHFTLDGDRLQIDSLVAAKDTENSARPRLTLEPLSLETGMEIAQPCADHAVGQLVAWLKAQPANETTLISWHHTKMAKLLAALGADPTAILPNGRWPDDVFDWVVALRFDAQGKLIPSETQVVREPAAVNDVVWKTMGHPVIRPLDDQVEPAGSAVERLAER
ncbi:hypothetical protein [Acidisoma sp. 7E03]